MENLLFDSNKFQDTMWAVVFATSNANVTLTCGNSSAKFPVKSGVNKLKIPLAPGGMSVKMVRNGQIVIQAKAINYTYSESPPLTCTSFYYYCCSNVVSLLLLSLFGFNKTITTLGLDLRVSFY